MWPSTTRAMSPRSSVTYGPSSLQAGTPGERNLMSQIITRLFDNFADAERAVVELERVGVPHGDISLVSHKSDKKHAGVKVREPHDHTAGEAGAIDAGAGAAAG